MDIGARQRLRQENAARQHELSMARQNTGGGVGRSAHAGHSHHAHEHSHVPLPGHENHEGWHTMLFFVFIFLIIIAQVLIHYWKKNGPKSFLQVTLVGLWIFPFGYSVYLHWFRFVFVWLCFTAYSLYLIKLTRTKPIHTTTPRKIYKWFYLVYRSCYGVAVFGYILFMLEFFGLGRAVGFGLGQIGFMLIFYGLYFAVLGRDLAEWCSDSMSSSMGYSASSGLSRQKPRANICMICSNPLMGAIGEEISDEIVKLNCEHSYHESCIRGWTVVGKKDTCPYCLEKVDLKKLFPSNPWNQQTVYWGEFLNIVRYLVVWNPLIMLSIQVILHFLDPPDGHGPSAALNATNATNATTILA